MCFSYVAIASCSVTAVGANLRGWPGKGRPYNHKSSPPLDARLARLASRQHGAVKRTQLLALGLSVGGVKERIKRGGPAPQVRRGLRGGAPEALAGGRMDGRGARGRRRCRARRALRGLALGDLGRADPHHRGAGAPRPQAERAGPGAHLPPARPRRRHGPQGHPGDHRGAHARRPHRGLRRAPAGQRDPRGGLPQALRPGGDPRRDGTRERAAQAQAARTGDRDPPHRQRRDQEPRRSSVPEAREAGGAAVQRDRRGHRGRLLLPRAPAGRRDRRSEPRPRAITARGRARTARPRGGRLHAPALHERGGGAAAGAGA